MRQGMHSTIQHLIDRFADHSIIEIDETTPPEQQIVALVDQLDQLNNDLTAEIVASYETG